jgi:hypothetical protein
VEGGNETLMLTLQRFPDRAVSQGETLMADTRKNTSGKIASKTSKTSSGDIGSNVGDKGKPGNVTGEKATTAKSKGPGGDYDKGSTRE